MPEYREKLPDSCPPTGASCPPNKAEYWRLIPSEVVADGDFDSYQKKKSHVAYPDPCRACGVSLFTTFEHCKVMVKLKSLKDHTHAAKVVLDQNCGMVEANTPNHVTWWIAAACVPKHVVVEVRSLKD